MYVVKIATWAYPKYKGFLFFSQQRRDCLFFRFLYKYNYMYIYIYIYTVSIQTTWNRLIHPFNWAFLSLKKKRPPRPNPFFPAKTECGFRGLWRAMKRKASSRNLVVTILLRILPLAPWLLHVKEGSYSHYGLPSQNEAVFYGLVLWWWIGWCCLGNKSFNVHHSPLKHAQLIISQLKHVCTCVVLALVFRWHYNVPMIIASLY